MLSVFASGGVYGLFEFSEVESGGMVMRGEVRHSVV